jgi:hypothetical protein
MPFLGKQPFTGEFKKLDTIVPNGASSYALNYDGAAFTPGQAERLQVSVNGVMQAPNVAFTVNGSTITFSEALTASDVIDFIVSMGEVGNTTTVSDGSVTPAKLASNLVLDSTPIRVNTDSIDVDVTIAANQNAFVAGPITINSTMVINGTFTVI